MEDWFDSFYVRVSTMTAIIEPCTGRAARGPQRAGPGIQNELTGRA